MGLRVREREERVTPTGCVRRVFVKSARWLLFPTPIPSGPLSGSVGICAYRKGDEAERRERGHRADGSAAGTGWPAVAAASPGSRCGASGGDCIQTDRWITRWDG